MNNTTILLRKWTKDEDDLLRSLYPDTSMSKMQAALNRGKQAIRRRAELLGITRSEAYQEKIGRSRHLFTEGGTPWNKHQEKSWTDDDKKNLAAMRETGHQQMAAACSAIEQALDSYVLTKDKQSHVHIS